MYQHLNGFFVLAALLGAQAAFAAVVGAATEQFALVHILEVLLWMGLAVAYLNSSVRLRRVA
ncbi:hypothetical protein [Leifsonia sp. AG29]|uniref:hypothetical protein n=1 Tax=Leifsonia sp. AG29 TaxID=2598860 RepID=UPI00131CC2A9|nr:hypothetical protein [Leifsonia sp. AG29]